MFGGASKPTLEKMTVYSTAPVDWAIPIYNNNNNIDELSRIVIIIIFIISDIFIND